MLISISGVFELPLGAVVEVLRPIGLLGPLLPACSLPPQVDAVMEDSP